MDVAVTSLAETSIEHHHAELDGVRLHYVEAGPRTGRPIVLLHGFPEFWYAWRHQIPALARAGLRVIAPDMRGYGESDKPRGVASYAVETLADDVAGLVRAVGAERATIVGHDWGGIVAWWFAMRHPELLDRLVVLNCPHPGRQLAMTFDPAQLRRSFYMLFFQLPKLPELLLAHGGSARLKAGLARDAAHRDAFGDVDLERYGGAWAGAFEPMLNYYRALLRRSPWTLRRQLRTIDKPVQVIWGARDRHLGFEYAEPPAKWVWHCRFDVIDDATHWVHLDVPARVNALILDFLGLRGGS
ncbi:MAG TPA: alpha/beta hydrolase [Nannocystaceae bacterium]|nr:alpha/beta hydrolase [Nannocystaceae bacterium]